MRSKKPLKGQVTLLGDIYSLELKYQPHVSISDSGEAVVVLRVPREATEIERKAGLRASKELASTVKSFPGYRKHKRK